MHLKHLAVLAAAVWASPVAAAPWFEARSPHFTVYAQGSAASVEAQALQLEQFDAAIRRVLGLQDRKDVGVTPVTIYVIPTVSTVQRLCRCSNAYGFYRPSVTGVVAFTPMRGGGETGPTALTPRIVLYHEYGHHLLLGNFGIAYPNWYSEGFAEFVSTATVDKDSIMVGRAAQHRAYALIVANQMAAKQLFAGPSAKMNGEQIEQIYARGWLLTHYFTFNKERRAQFGDYLTRLNKGEPSVAAATAAFGDLRKLDKELDAYLDQRKLMGLRIPLSTLPTPKITVTQLSPGAQAMMALRYESDAGVDEKQAADLYRRAVPIAALYPGDALVQGWFAEMAYDAKHDDAVAAAADRALAVDPGSAQALLYRARVALRKDAEGKDPAALTEARRWIVKANRANPDNPEALYMFYRSFLDVGETPRKSAVAGLSRAVELVPQDDELRLAAARQAIIDGDRDGARAALRPIAFAPHAEDNSNSIAARLLALIDSGQSGSAALTAFDAETKRLADANVRKK